MYLMSQSYEPIKLNDKHIITSTKIVYKILDSINEKWDNKSSYISGL